MFPEVGRAVEDLVADFTRKSLVYSILCHNLPCAQRDFRDFFLEVSSCVLLEFGFMFLGCAMFLESTLAGEWGIFQRSLRINHCLLDVFPRKVDLLALEVDLVTRDIDQLLFLVGGSVLISS